MREEITEIEMKKTIERSMKLKAGTLKRSTKLMNLQPELIKKKREKAQINKIKNEKEGTTDARKYTG